VSQCKIPPLKKTYMMLAHNDLWGTGLLYSSEAKDLNYVSMAAVKHVEHMFHNSHSDIDLNITATLI
jgi:hypothetical protein